MTTEYSQEFKESMLQKIFFNPDRSVVSFAREANIPGSTVATWVRSYKKKNGKIMGQRKRKKLWSAEKSICLRSSSAARSSALSAAAAGTITPGTFALQTATGTLPISALLRDLCGFVREKKL